MRGEIFTDASMLEIFRAEVETHVESLMSGLLALERDPGETTHIDEMMRGAHSIKGAARIVGIEPAVRVAHVMEDGFVAAQNGKLTLRPQHVDALLRGVDMLNRIANGSKDLAVDWTQFDGEATSLVAEIAAVLAGIPVSLQNIPGPLEHRATQTIQATPLTLASSEQHSPTINEISISLLPFLDATAAEVARRAFVAGLDAKARVIRFDLSLTTDLDAIGLALLAAVPAYVNRGGPRVELIGAAADLRNVLEATGIGQLYSSGGR